MKDGHTSTVYTFWSMIPRMVHIPSHQQSIRYTYLMSIDTNEEVSIYGNRCSFLPRIEPFRGELVTFITAAITLIAS